MATFNICPVCGNRMTLDTATNDAGDSLNRWRCGVNADYSSEWELASVALGTTDTPHPRLLQENPPPTEGTTAALVQTLRTNMAELLARVGPVTPGTSLVEEMRRVYGAVDTLELTSESIALNADSINLNTDTLENLVSSTNTRLGDPGDPDTYDTLIGRVKNLRSLIATAEGNRGTDAAAAQARLDLLATEAGLIAARDALVAKGEEQRAILATFPTREDFLNSAQVVSDYVQRRARDGMAYVASTGRQQLTLSGYARVAIANPAGSGRQLFIYRLAAATSAGPAWAVLHSNPTTGLPAAARPRTNMLLGGSASVANMTADVSTTAPLGGGVDTGLVFGLFTGRNVIDLDAPLIVPPGNTLGFNVPFAGAADSAMSLYWWEEATA